MIIIWKEIKVFELTYYLSMISFLDLKNILANKFLNLINSYWFDHEVVHSRRERFSLKGCLWVGGAAADVWLLYLSFIYDSSQFRCYLWPIHFLHAEVQKNQLVHLCISPFHEIDSPFYLFDRIGSRNGRITFLAIYLEHSCHHFDIHKFIVNDKY